MANEQTSVPLFVADTILTAAQQNISAGTGVPVFATTVTRDAAFGGANKALAEGQLCYLSASNIVQYYDGAAWATVGPAAAGGLTFITGTTFATATNFSLPTNTFSATYQNYKLFITLTALTADADFTLRLRAAGTDDATSEYDNMFEGITRGGAANNGFSAAASSFLLGESDTLSAGRYSLILDFVAPQLALATSIFGCYNFVDKAATTQVNRTGGATFRQTTVFDSATFISSVASSITGNYKVYGYANS